MRKLNVTDGQTDGRTDGGRCNISRPGPSAPREITREIKNNHQFFIYGPQCEKMRILGYSGGPGWAHLASQASSHLYQSTYKIWKQSDKDFLSYRENDEVSADADAAA